MSQQRYRLTSTGGVCDTLARELRGELGVSESIEQSHHVAYLNSTVNVCPTPTVKHRMGFFFRDRPLLRLSDVKTFIKVEGGDTRNDETHQLQTCLQLLLSHSWAGGASLLCIGRYGTDWHDMLE